MAKLSAAGGLRCLLHKNIWLWGLLDLSESINKHNNWNLKHQDTSYIILHHQAPKVAHKSMFTHHLSSPTPHQNSKTSGTACTVAKAVRKARHHLKPGSTSWVVCSPKWCRICCASATNLSATGFWNLISINNPEETIQTIPVDPYMSLTWHGNNKLGNVKDLLLFFQVLSLKNWEDKNLQLLPLWKEIPSPCVRYSYDPLDSIPTDVTQLIPT